MDSELDSLAKHGFLIGSVLLGIVLLYVGIAVASAVAGLASEVHRLREPKPDAHLETSTEESLERLSQSVDSLHGLFGGRQWQRDDLDEALDGPTIQSLLRSIADSLKKMSADLG